MTAPVKIDCDGHIPFPPRQVWPILSKTDWLNRSAGLPPVEYTVEPAKAGGSEVEAQAKAFGLKLRWKEMPWEWLEGHFYRVRRIFRGGPFAEGTMGMEFQATPDGGTFVHVFSEFTPRGLAGTLIARHALAPQVRKSMRAAIAHAAEHLRGAAKNTLPKLSIHSPVEDALGAGLRGLAAAGEPPALVAALEELLRDSPDVELSHIRPWAVARAWKTDRWDTLRLFLQAARCGLLDFRWEVLCPNCRSTRRPAIRALAALSRESHCEVCQIRYDAEFDRSVELKFMVNPSIRPVDGQTFCLVGPGGRPHVASQAVLEAGQSKVWKLPPLDRPYRLRSPQVKQSALLNPDAEETQIPVSAVCGSEAFEITFAPGHGREPAVQIRNTSGFPMTLMLEEVEWSGDILTAAQASNWQEFRDLFSTEVISPHEQITVGAQIILFTDLRGSTAMYNGMGDAPAYVLVRDHFRILIDAVREHHGAVVKTIGDAVMAVFSSVEEALAAVKKMHDELAASPAPKALAAPLALKSSLHLGPCLAVSANDKLDFFGTTVNLAARMVECCKGGDLTISEELWKRPETQKFLSATGKTAEPSEVKFRGFEKAIPVRRIEMVK